MLRAAVYERDVSLNREFIESCVRSYGVVRIFENLLCYLQEGTDYEKSGAVSAFYWVAGTGNRDAAPFIREFYRLILAPNL